MGYCNPSRCSTIAYIQKLVGPVPKGYPPNDWTIQMSGIPADMRRLDTPLCVGCLLEAPTEDLKRGAIERN